MRFFSFFTCLDIEPPDEKEVEEEVEPPEKLKKMIPKKRHRHIKRELTTLKKSAYYLNKKDKKVEECNQKYVDFKYICSGYFAKVYTAKDRYNNIVAIKKIHCNTRHINMVARREIEMLLSIKSSHIIKIKDVVISRDNMYIVLPYYEVDLFTYIPKVLGRPNKIF